MASEIRVDKITSLSGVGTISPSPTGVEIAGITTVATLKATTGIVTTLTATTGIVTTLTTNTLTANSTTKVGSGVTLSPDGDIFATGITTVGVIETDKISLGDNERISLGISSDLSIYHDGNDSRIIDSGTGRLIFSSNQVQLNNSANTEVLAKFIENGAVELYHNNTRRLSTTGAGISVSQSTGGFSEFRHGGSNSGVRIAGPAESSGANLIFANNHNNSTNDEWAIQLQGSTDDLLFIEGGHSGNEKLRILETGGITFNGDTATANALDDYEEGDWTPKQTDGGTNYTANHAKYVKIGKLVHLTFDITSSSSTNLTQIWNLPFTPANYSSWHTAYYAINATTTGTGTAGYSSTRHGGLVVPALGGYLHTRIVGGTVTWNITNTDRLIGSATYETSA